MGIKFREYEVEKSIRDVRIASIKVVIAVQLCNDQFQQIHKLWNKMFKDELKKKPFLNFCKTL